MLTTFINNVEVVSLPTHSLILFLLQPAWVKNSFPLSLSLLLRLHKHIEGGGEHFRSGHPAQHLIHNIGAAGCGGEDRIGQKRREEKGRGDERSYNTGETLSSSSVSAVFCASLRLRSRFLQARYVCDHLNDLYTHAVPSPRASNTCAM